MLFTRSSALLLALGMAAATPLLSQKPLSSGSESEQQDIALDAAWQAFQQQVGGTWIIDRHPATGTPQAIYGTGLRLENWLESSEQQARVHGAAALVRWHDLLGLGASQFQVGIAGKMGGTWALVYEQYFHGVPVIGGRADVRIHESGVISLLGSVAWPIPAGFNTVPVLNAGNAEFNAWKALGVQPKNVPQPAKQGTRLVIWGDVNAAARAPFFLAWEVGISAVDAEGNGPIGRYYVDAMTGAALHWQNDKHDCGFPGCSHHGHGGHADHGHDDVIGPPVLDVSGTVMGWTRTGLNAADPLVNVPLPGLEVVVAGVGTAITDTTGAFSIPTTLTTPVSVTVNMNGIHCTLISGANAPSVTQSLTPGTPGSFQVLTQAAASADAAHTGTYWWVYTANEWIRGILGNTSQMATADSVHPTVNIASTCNAYYTGNTINFYAAGGSCNNTGFSTVVVHEWGHGIDDRYGGISNNTGDGLSEAWGDTIAMYAANDPEIGRGFNVGATTGIRTGLNTRQWPTISTLEVHTAGECYMGFCWKVRDRLRTTQGVGPGTQIAETIVIGSIIANATNQTNAVREIFIADDNDGNLLNGVPHYAELTYAAAIHAMPFPAIQVGTIAHTPLGSTSVQLTPRVVNATVTPYSGSFTDVRVHYNDGTGAQSRSMLPNGQPNGYQALLPGVIAPGAVTYHFEAQHISGPLLRLPVTGEYSTVTGGPETRLFFDDFESGAPGWTHGWVSVEDDWQLATPLGRSGTSLGVAWADPSAAYSGTHCFGNDLTNNGNYSANVQNWLHAPLLNTVGQFGLKLRFRRWLTVEQGIYDQAVVRVNGTTVWSNPLNSHTIDTTWQFMELPIPQADNNPQVTIEWRLTADGGLQLGGWTIDDVEVVAVGPLSPLDAQLRVTPAMGPVGGPLSLDLAIRPNTPFILALGNTAGPTSIPGIPIMQVGGSYVALPGWTDAAGNFNLAFTGPGVPSMINAFWYSQALTLDPAFNFVTSNAWINLFSN